MDKRNRIILLIDFSEYSENLTEFAFKMSEIIQAKVVFVHRISGVVPAMADQAGREAMVTAESEAALSKLRRLAEGRVYSDDTFHVSQKPVLTILKEMASDHYFDWVFAGLKGTGALKRLFIGSTTVSIVDESDLLTVAVPGRNQVSVPKKLMVGVNPQYPINREQFGRVLSALGPHINQVEFFTVVKDDEDEIKAEEYLSGLQAEYAAHQPMVGLYKGANAFELLKDRVVVTENSFLVLQQGSRSIADKLFRTFMINELVYGAHTPLIVLSS